MLYNNNLPHSIGAIEIVAMVWFWCNNSNWRHLTDLWFCSKVGSIPILTLQLNPKLPSKCLTSSTFIKIVSFSFCDNFHFVIYLTFEPSVPHGSEPLNRLFANLKSASKFLIQPNNCHITIMFCLSLIYRKMSVWCWKTLAVVLMMICTLIQNILRTTFAIHYHRYSPISPTCYSSLDYIRHLPNCSPFFVNGLNSSV